MHKMKLLIVLAAVAIPAAATRVALAEINTKNPPQGVISEGWYAVFLNGQRAGHMHARMERKGGDIVSDSQVQLSVRRGAVQIDIGMNTTSTETLDGTPKQYEAVMDLGSAMNTKTNVTFGGVGGKVATVESSQMGFSSKETFNLSERPYLPWAMLKEQQRRGLEPGTTFNVPAYEPTLRADDVVQTTIEVEKAETIDLLGRSVEAIRTSTMIESLGTPQIAWVDQDGDILKTVMPVAGFQFEMVRCDKAFAMQDLEAPEMFVKSMVPIGRSLDRDKLQSLTLRLSIDDKTFPKVPETTLQHVKRIDDRTVELTIQRIDHDQLKNAKSAKPAGDAVECLRASTYLNYNDAEVAKMAADAVKNSKTLYEKVDDLRKYVTREISDKSLDVGLATASEVARTREGDCTEHGVLLAALGRGNAIPARVATGLIYVEQFQGQPNVFGFHMWTQFFIEGKWVDVDAAFRETDVDPTHITLSVSPMNDEGFMDTTFSILPLIGKLKIEVVDTKP